MTEVSLFFERRASSFLSSDSSIQSIFMPVAQGTPPPAEIVMTTPTTRSVATRCYVSPLLIIIMEDTERNEKRTDAWFL
jgi:hypothetical protein